MLKINDVDLDFDVAKYLRQKGLSFNVISGNAQMCCPFHNDSNPSFGISLKTGVYHCLAGSCGAKGNLAGFVQKIENMSSYDEAASWLIHQYGVNIVSDDQPFELEFSDEKQAEARIVYINDDELMEWAFRHPYLEGRGISDLWQRRFRVGYDKDSFAITIPWFDRHGQCVAVKKRSVLSKAFWVYKLSDIGPNAITMYGIDHIYRRKERFTVITESEIDTMWNWQNGFPSVALGTSSVNNAQLKELKNTWIESVVIATDNDDAGRKIARTLVNKLTWIPDVKIVDWSLYPNKKDVNDLGAAELRTLLLNAVEPFYLDVG